LLANANATNDLAQHKPFVHQAIAIIVHAVTVLIGSLCIASNACINDRPRLTTLNTATLTTTLSTHCGLRQAAFINETITIFVLPIAIVIVTGG
jgi:hypothetical protein